jgi:hypothetical protein
VGLVGWGTVAGSIERPPDDGPPGGRKEGRDGPHPPGNDRRGRTTGLTFGVVIATHGSYAITDSSGNPLWWLLDRFRIERHAQFDFDILDTFAQPGDSGSVIVNEHDEVVGLLVSNGSDFGIEATATPAPTVATMLQIEFT